MTLIHLIVTYLVLGALAGAGLAVLNMLYARDKDTPTERPSNAPRMMGLLGYFAGVLTTAATCYRFHPYSLETRLTILIPIAVITSFMLVHLAFKALRNHGARKSRLRWRYGALLLLPLLMMGTGCATGLKDLGDDHAAVQMTIVTPWGTQKVSRVNPATNQSASITADGVMTITSK